MRLIFGLIQGIVALSLLAASMASTPAGAQDRPGLNGVALVVGQSAYENIADLPNPANDARAMVKLLTDLGFEARSVSDRDAKKLSRDLERFVEDAGGADVAFLYYSGHGIESGGENWLVPVDASVESLADARETLVSVTAVIDALKQTVPVSIVLLDACRTSPFPPGSEVKETPTGSAEPIGTQGLTLVRGAKAIGGAAEAADNLGIVVGFAAEPGRPALDGPVGQNSPYAAALLRHLSAMDGAEFGAVMRMVTEEVYLDTKARQRPWANESLRRFLYFGASPEQPTGDEGLITGERRKLLLTISDLPAANRAQIESLALKNDVPLDAVYGVMRALGTEKIPEDPTELEKVLDAQASRIKAMIEQREALSTDDPEIARLTASADHALREGAIAAARKFLDDAVARIEAKQDEVDDAEASIRKKRLADAAIYAQRGDASGLAFDYGAAARDYRKAFDLVERWDETLRWNYKNFEAEALAAEGGATGNRVSLQAALAAYRVLLDYVPRGEETADWAITRNNMAVVYQTIGERETDAESLREAAKIFRASLAYFAKTGDDRNWAAAQNNLGNVYLRLGQRDSDPQTLRDAVAAFRATFDKRPRDTAPLDWASSQNNIGIALFSLSERETGDENLAAAERAYRLALEEYTREKKPVEWAMVQNNLGNTLNALGEARNDPAKFTQAAAAFRAALEVRTRDHFPLSWATSRLNLGSALSSQTRFEVGTALLEEAAAALDDALTVYTRDKFPLDWAEAENNRGAMLQTLGQRKRDGGLLAQSASAFRATVRVYTRKAFPLDWAAANLNLGNTLRLLGMLTSEPLRYEEAIAAYTDALDEYGRQNAPRQWAVAKTGMATALHALSNFEDTTASLLRSIAARREALEVLTIANTPIDWATAQDGLGASLLSLGTREKTGKYLGEAEAAFRASLKVFTRAEQPLQWALAQNNLGDAAWNRASYGGGKAALLQAMNCFELARQGLAEGGGLTMIPLVDTKIGLLRERIAKT